MKIALWLVALEFMFDRVHDALYLQSRLEAFIGQWHGHRKPWYGIAPDKLEQTQLPQPLRWLYGFAGEWQGRHYWDTLLGNQDLLLPYESLATRDGKLVFVVENQGVWQVATDLAGDDPPVWARLEEGPWQLIDQSLTRFLVTFVLHETGFGCQQLGSGENMLAQLTTAGLHVVPLWLDHPYPYLFDDRPARSISFHIANRDYLVMDDYWCATNLDAPWDALPAIFKCKERPSSSGGFDPYAPLPVHLQVPSFLRRSHLQDVIRRHEQEAEYHEQHCALYRRMLAEMPAE